MKLEEFIAIKEKVKNLQRQKDKHQGMLESLYKRLKQEFKCDTLEEANILLFNLQREQEQEEDKLQALMEEFQGKYGGKF